MKRLVTAALAATAAFAGAGALAAPASAADTATVYVVHGIPDTPVNVFVDGASALQNFTPATVAGPLDLPAGPHEVEVFPASDTAGTGTPVITANATLEAGQNVSLVAHLTADGKPTLTPFVNDTSTIAAGKAGLVVRHTAAAPAVDVRANGQVAFSNLTNPNEDSAELDPGTISADVTLAGTDTVAIGPADVTLNAGTQTIVYAIGSATEKSLALVVQNIDHLGSAPGGVPAGTGGLAATNGSSTPEWVWVASALGLLVAAGGVAGVVARQRREALAGAGH
ncbi:DUF4397 domain-containing protein [Jatrophihabitans sp. YIM 134969]